MDKNILKIDTVGLDDVYNKLVIIDQTLLPNETKILSLDKQEDIWYAIKTLQVRGAPAIGVTAAIGVYLAALDIDTDDYDTFKTEFTKSKNYLATSRPTAINLFWALDCMQKVVDKNVDKSVSNIKKLLHDEAVKIREDDIASSRAIGEYGLTLLKDGDGILTHCNAGQLATVRYGTALAPIHVGRERGMNFKVFTDETRPLLQGARLSAYELIADGVDTTVICDNMASQVMKNGWIQAVITGADRIAANGDSCNKIGTSGVAILAKYYNIPFYIAAPCSTIDMNVNCGADIPIEQRSPDEVTELWYEKRMAPDGVNVYNPAFDFVDNELISAIITEKGIIYPPFADSLKKIMEI